MHVWGGAGPQYPQCTRRRQLPWISRARVYFLTYYAQCLMALPWTWPNTKAPDCLLLHTIMPQCFALYAHAAEWNWKKVLYKWIVIPGEGSITRIKPAAFRRYSSVHMIYVYDTDEEHPCWYEMRTKMKLPGSKTKVMNYNLYFTSLSDWALTLGDMWIPSIKLAPTSEERKSVCPHFHLSSLPSIHWTYTLTLQSSRCPISA